MKGRQRVTLHRL